jgi:DNA-binding transcriptional ArsR family regulator
VVAIGLSAGSVARVRFAVSALWEVAVSVRVLRSPGQHAVHLPWAHRVRPSLTAAGLIGPDGGLLWQLIVGSGSYMPDFLTPPPSGLVADLDAELAVLRATPTPVVRADLETYQRHRTGAVAALYADPPAGLAVLADEISRYWELAVQPWWSRIRLLLDAEIFARGRALAGDGLDGLLNDLHQRVRWADDTLRIMPRLACTRADVVEGGGLLLVPSVFAWPTVLSVAAARPPQLAYPVRGIASLWEESPVTGEPVADLIGRTRAQLLTAVAVPASTTDLARRFGLSAGAVSQHLAVLRAAGLVTAHRQGRSILNAQTTVAEALLAAG